MSRRERIDYRSSPKKLHASGLVCGRTLGVVYTDSGFVPGFRSNNSFKDRQIWDSRDQLMGSLFHRLCHLSLAETTHASNFQQVGDNLCTYCIYSRCSLGLVNIRGNHRIVTVTINKPCRNLMFLTSVHCWK